MRGGDFGLPEKLEQIEELTVTLSALSALFNLTDRRIRQLADEGVVVKHSRGKYDLFQSVQNYIRLIKSNSSVEKVKSDTDFDLDRERALHEAVKREKSELSLAVMKGELHEAKDVEKVMTDMLTNFRGKILSLPSKLAPILMARDDVFIIQSIIEKEVHMTLYELSEYDPTMFYSEKVVEIDDEALNYLGEDGECEQDKV